jgi:hypothetical protein
MVRPIPREISPSPVSVETTERMRIQGSTGNVGIGTNNPDTDFKLHVHGGPTKSDGFVLGTGTNEYTPGCIYTDGNWGMLFRSAVETPGAADFVFNNYSGSNLMAIKSGKVGIGTANPAAKLHVNGGAGGIYATAADFTRYFSWGTGSSVVGGTGNFNFTSISVYGTNDIGTAGTFVSTIRAITASDKRIKRDVVDIEDDEALQLLRLIEPKKYKYKDVLGRGDEEVYGFIAQQISNVFPEATQLRSSRKTPSGLWLHQLYKRWTANSKLRKLRLLPLKHNSHRFLHDSML